ncbi:hypothetical protein [Glaciibacter psychrotolerans]|uniref:Uncharacterized protein n=1 Tax=Glaciibacter psychrotolerans TaxID=670054 RepID=A0A7Z0EGY2_9MICO|nr:hypothetical protein [Leifsonia psychrotolerans]NYJ21438.1 hypothetical protein [Leifsonia psychrotolerans]
MSFLPKDELNPKKSGDKGDKNGPSRNRIVLWVIMGGVGAYLVLSGVIGLLTT